MTASIDAAPVVALPAIIRRYYLAMGVPFMIDLITIAAYAVIYQAPQVLPPLILLSSAFLVVGVGIGAYFLIRPIGRFMAGQIPFAEAEQAIASLPRRSCALMAVCYAPMIGLRLLSRRLGVHFEAVIEDPTWLDLVTSFVVITGYNVLLTFFVVSAYLDLLCEHLFQTRGVNLGVFHGRFRRKMAFAMLFMAFAGTILLSGDI